MTETMGAVALYVYVRIYMTAVYSTTDNKLWGSIAAEHTKLISKFHGATIT